MESTQNNLESIISESILSNLAAQHFCYSNIDKYYENIFYNTKFDAIFQVLQTYKDNVNMVKYNTTDPSIIADIQSQPDRLSQTYDLLLLKDAYLKQVIVPNDMIDVQTNYMSNGESLCNNFEMISNNLTIYKSFLESLHNIEGLNASVSDIINNNLVDILNACDSVVNVAAQYINNLPIYYAYLQTVIPTAVIIDNITTANDLCIGDVVSYIDGLNHEQNYVNHFNSSDFNNDIELALTEYNTCKENTMSSELINLINQQQNRMLEDAYFNHVTQSIIQIDVNVHAYDDGVTSLLKAFSFDLEHYNKYLTNITINDVRLNDVIISFAQFNKIIDDVEQPRHDRMNTEHLFFSTIIVPLTFDHYEKFVSQESEKIVWFFLEPNSRFVTYFYTLLPDNSLSNIVANIEQHVLNIKYMKTTTIGPVLNNYDVDKYVISKLEIDICETIKNMFMYTGRLVSTEEFEQKIVIPLTQYHFFVVKYKIRTSMLIAELYRFETTYPYVPGLMKRSLFTYNLYNQFTQIQYKILHGN